MKSMFRIRASAAVVAFGATIAVPALALDSNAPAADRRFSIHADETACAGTFSIFRPTPSSCLGPIETDRPHKTDTPQVVAPGHAQVELGVVEYELWKLRGASSDQLVLLNNIYKIGLVNGIDLEALHAMGSYGVRSRRVALGDQLMLRSKLQVLGGEGAPISLSLVPAAIVPLSRTASADGGGFVFFGAELPFELELEVNVGGLSERDPDSGRRHAAMIGTTAVTRRIFGPASLFVELYNDTTSSAPSKLNGTFDSGILVAMGRDAQLDFGAYTGVYGDVPALSPFLGVSVRR